MTILDPELLEAFVPEFADLCGRLSAAAEVGAAGRGLDALHGMAGAFGIASLVAMIEAAREALDPFDPTMPETTAQLLRARLAAIADAGADLPPEAAPAGPGRLRVLIVDDSALMRRLLREAVAEDAGVEVVAEAADGTAALRAMAEHQPDVTLLDIEMPVLDGFGVLRRRALFGGPGAVVVVSSAAPPGSPAAVALRRLGAQAVVGKPSGAFSPDLARQAGAAIRAALRGAVP
ncbi:response regulator receiver domain-containing protein [Humitalea rosea]|uniref:Response regulator receiver domain-containing protein n=1 Tax=Humitalea rosea TaxID=990373 RepID=A0A2W7KLA5_9PROT|nr:response regulator [Humitalea rosea]PZW49098.1 response regulator receiver domain-containing protein [Humitalea rosea]